MAGLVESCPLSHHLLLRGHERGVTALTLDPKCSRLLSGSADSSVKMWNFAGMDQSARSFRRYFFGVGVVVVVVVVVVGWWWCVVLLFVIDSGLFVVV